MRLIDRMPPTVRSAEDLLLDFEQTGNAAPFEEIVRRYSAMVYGVCYRVTRNAHDAEDSTQATFLKLALQARTTNGIPRVGPWLQRVAKTTAMDLRRSRTRRTNREFIRAEMNSREEADVESADDAVRMDEVKQLLRAEVDELPPNYRTPLILYYFGGLSTEEIAKELGSNAKALAVRLFRGRQMLANRLKERGIGNAVGSSMDHGVGVAMKVAVGDAILSSLADKVLVPAGGRRLPQSMAVTLTSHAASALADRICAVARACIQLPRAARWGLGGLFILSLSSAFAGSQTRFMDQPVTRQVGQWLQGMRRVLNLIGEVKPAEVAPVAAAAPAAPPTAIAAKEPVELLQMPPMPRTIGLPNIPTNSLMASTAALPPTSVAVAKAGHAVPAAALSTGVRSGGAAMPLNTSPVAANASTSSRRPGGNDIEISATGSLLAMNSCRPAAKAPSSASSGASSATTVAARFPGAPESEFGPMPGALAVADASSTMMVDTAPIDIASSKTPGAIGAASTGPTGAGEDSSSVLSTAGNSNLDPTALQPNIGSGLAPETSGPIPTTSSPIPEPAGLAAVGVIGLLLSRRRVRRR